MRRWAIPRSELIFPEGQVMRRYGVWLTVVVAMAAGFMLAKYMEVPSTLAQDAPKVSPVEPRARDFYVPNSEALGPDEMRIVACGTGMPTARPKQAASCWLVELGNGDKFIFDLGTGSAERISAMQIPYNYLDKVFLSHLHTDHFGDIMAMFVGGALMGRQKPLQVWGPTGDTPERGTKSAIDHVRKALTWDLDGRKGLTDPRGYYIEAHEFEYEQVNQVVYEENGVTIRSWPAIHALNGAVSFSLEWNVTPQSALAVGTQIHTAPEAFGKVMSMIEPRMAVAYHFFKDFDTAGDILTRIRTTYDGPLSLAEDYMVWNVTKDDIRVRLAIIDEDVWPPPASEKPQAPDPSGRIPYSEFILGGKLDMHKVIQPIYDEVNKQYNLDEKQE